MSKRAANLAKIQDYLTGASSGTSDQANAPTPAPDDGLPEGTEPHAAPGLKAEAGEKLQPGESPEEQQEQSELEQKTDVAAAKLQQVVNYSKFRLEALPMPGGLFLPIALLFVFFLALLPIGGKTRLSWLWNVITGNAELNQAEDVIPVPGTKIGGPVAPLTTTPTTPAPTPTPATLPAPTLPTVPIAPFFTGVEEPS